MSNLEDLVLAYRILASHGVVDAYGHASCRNPDNPGRYFISRSLAPELVTLDDIVELDLDSDPVVPGEARGLYLERFIHGEIYKTHPQVNAVVHNHSPSVIPFGATNVRLQPLINTAAFVGRGIPTFEIRDFQKDGDILIDSHYLGNALAGILGPHPAALMRGHGAVVVGGSIAEAVIRSVYLEVSARIQTQTMLLAGPGGQVNFYTPAEVEAVVTRQDAKQTWRRPWNMWRENALRSMAMEREQLADRRRKHDARAEREGNPKGCCDTHEHRND